MFILTIMFNFRLDEHNRKFGHFINNKWVHPDGRKTYATTTPATGHVLASTAQGTSEDVDQGESDISSTNSSLERDRERFEFHF